jgi:EAL domain-containing protein (putative c-di-GMP-specific phosphodiesterase class I)/GGDEF domain-containing protein
LPNRSSLEQAIARDGGNPRVLVAAAIERFEVIRDGIGLAATNDVIRKAADQVATVTESQVHRLSPDVIAWVLTGCEEAAVDATVRKIQSLFREPIQSQAGPVDVAFTLGLDHDDGCSSPVLRVERALAAIGNARSKGIGADWYRNTNPQDRRQLSMMSDLRHAMNNGGLRVVYQPKMSLETGRITDAEALVRWHDESGRTISPDEFIPLAEATGVIREVTVFALRAALADLSRWGPSGVPLRLAVNVSALDLVTEDFAKQVGAILEDAAVPPRQLTLEVTESALIRSPAEAIATLVELRDLGVRLSVDDYGTGQSTLSYLKHLPVHELKIDKSFVTTLAGSESDAIMVRSTINLAHELGLQVVAEGIEDRETLDMLRKLGCDYAQGFFISKPIEPDELFALISGQEERKRVA